MANDLSTQTDQYCDENELLRVRLEELDLPEGKLFRFDSREEIGKSGYFRIKGRIIEEGHFSIKFDIVTNFRIVVGMELEKIIEIVTYGGVDYLIGSKQEMQRDKKPMGLVDKYFLKVLSNEGPENGENKLRYKDGIKYIGNGVFEYQESGETKTLNVSKEYVDIGDNRASVCDLSMVLETNNPKFIVFENSQNKKQGVKDEKGDVILECEYDVIRGLHDSKGKWYLLIKNGKYFTFNAYSCEVSPFEYEFAGLVLFQNGLLRCIDEQHQQYIYFDEDLNPVFETPEELHSVFCKNGFVCKCRIDFVLGLQYSIVNLNTGEELLPFLDLDVRMEGERFLCISDFGAYEKFQKFDDCVYFDFETGAFVNVLSTISSVQNGCFSFVPFVTMPEDEKDSSAKGDVGADELQGRVKGSGGNRKALTLFPE